MTMAMLKQFRFFEGLTPASMERMAATVKTVDLPENHVIFKRGDPAENVYGLLSGSVELTLPFTERVLKGKIDYEEATTAHYETVEKSVVIDAVDSGEIFGWSALVTPPVRTATARAAIPSKVLVIPGRYVRQFMDGNPADGYRLMSNLSNLVARRLRNRTQKLVDAWGEAFGKPQT